MLIASGYSNVSPTDPTAELYNPATGLFTYTTGPLTTGRNNFTATLLNTGQVLIAGGTGPGDLASAELYDPSTGTFGPTGSLNTATGYPSATLLSNGMVLIAGGEDGTAAELYDPTAGTFGPSGNLNTARWNHTATLLENGTVLFAGGYNGTILSSAEIYTPATLTPPGLIGITVTPVPADPLGTTQQFIATGTFSSGSQTLASVIWSSSNTGVAAITNDQTNRGNALGVAVGSTTITASAGAISGSTTFTVSPAPLSIVASSPLPLTYGSHVPVITVASYVGFVNGDTAASLTTPPSCGTAYTPATSVSTSPAPATFCMGATDSNYAITYVNGSVTVTQAPLTITASSTTIGAGAPVPTITAGYSGFVNTENSTNLTAQPTCSTTYTVGSPVSPPTYPTTCSGAVDNNYNISYVGGLVAVSTPATFSATGSMNIARSSPTVTLLQNGQVLVAGGKSSTGSVLASAELYDPATGLFNVTGSMSTPRYVHTATLLSNGQVLIAGGQSPATEASAELYDPSTGMFTLTTG